MVSARPSTIDLNRTDFCCRAITSNPRNNGIPALTNVANWRVKSVKSFAVTDDELNQDSPRGVFVVGCSTEFFVAVFLVGPDLLESNSTCVG